MAKRILLLTTGGTIASLPTEEGLAPGLDGEDLAELLPRGITDAYDLTIQDILHLDSSNIQPEEWQTIARHVFDNRGEYDGIVIPWPIPPRCSPSCSGASLSRWCSPGPSCP